MILLPPTLRYSTKNLFNQILCNRFNQALYNETLPIDVFSGFLRQDKIYLAYYGRALKQAALWAPNKTAQQKLNLFRSDTLQYEAKLLNTYLFPIKRNVFFPVQNKPLPVVKAYGTHLLNQRIYTHKIAALTPCFWLYASIGEHLDLEILQSNHHYLPWLKAYADPSFRTAAEEMVKLLDDCFENTESNAEQAVLTHIFFQSLKYEATFFEDAYTVQTEESLTHSFGVHDARTSPA